MGIFDRFQKSKVSVTSDKSTSKQRTTSAGKSADSEFSQDISELLNRDDVQCRQDICDIEYKKALQLAESSDESKLHRAYDIMGNLASQFDYAPAMLWMGNFAEGAMRRMDQAVYWYKKAADLGDGNGARNYADMLMAGKGVERDPRQALKYYTQAANSGIPEASFVLGEFLRQAGDTQQALKAYQAAFDGGFEMAKIRIEQMKNRG